MACLESPSSLRTRFNRSAESDRSGNVRELRAAIDRAVFLSDNGMLRPAALAEAIELGAANGATHATGKPNSARAQLVAICKANGWDSHRVGAALGVHRATLFRRLKQFGLSLRR